MERQTAVQFCPMAMLPSTYARFELSAKTKRCKMLCAALNLQRKLSVFSESCMRKKHERQTAVICVCVCVCVPAHARAANRCRLIVGMPERQTAANVIDTENEAAIKKTKRRIAVEPNNSYNATKHERRTAVRER